jgi:hypothetical protein
MHVGPLEPRLAVSSRRGGAGRPACRRYTSGAALGARICRREPNESGDRSLPSPAPEQAPGKTQHGVHGAGPPRVTCRRRSGLWRIEKLRAHRFGSHPRPLRDSLAV